MENIDKVINCGDPSYGGDMYGCPHCGNHFLMMVSGARSHISIIPTSVNPFRLFC
uniref:transposase zinc-binding domain-containing protein n=1 Tax=Eisenbergiella porci TaxID=2652274 RepID=UPI001F19183F|nr:MULTISPECIES: transposase zinc-binding domain-containing protein [Eisenbergiella]